MGSLNIEEWSPDQVAEWMLGLDPSVARYGSLLKERGLDGHRLLMLRCDDLEYLGMHIIGHQELLLEAVEHLRNFYERGRECVQQLAARVAATARQLARSLRHVPHALPTQALADVARLVHCVKPLVCWLDRWGMMVGSGSVSRETRTRLLQVCLEAATSAQRDRFAELPARAVAAAATAAANAADYIVQDVSDPLVLQPASLDAVLLRQRGRALGFGVARSFCGHYRLTDIQFGSPAHASGALHDGDEIVQVSGACVIGWSGARVLDACNAAAGGLAGATGGPVGGGPGMGGPGDVALRLRRTLRPYPKLNRFLHNNNDRAEPAYPPPPPPALAHSDSSDALSPPASPSHHTTRLYVPRPVRLAARRASVSGATPPRQRRHAHLEQFWRELKEQRFTRHSANISPEPDNSLYRRDKAVSCSTGLEVSPRPLTSPPTSNCPPPAPRPDPRGKLDKSHSTPAYDFDTSPTSTPSNNPPPPIPESPTSPTDSPSILVHSAEKADQILDFKKSSSQIGEAILQQQRREKTEFSFDTVLEDKTEKVLETINIAMMERQKDRSYKSQISQQSNQMSQSTQNSLSKQFSISEHVRNIQDEIVQAINDQRIIRHTKPARALGGDVPPEPPPRPPTTKPVLREAPLADPAFPVLRSVRQPELDHKESPPLKLRLDGSQISLPLRHITKHDIRVIPSERREMPALNGDPDLCLSTSQSDLRRRDCGLELSLGTSPTSPVKVTSPTTSVVRGIFPTSKSRSLKKKNSILARRRLVGAAELAAGGAAGGWALRRVRGSGGGAAKWEPRLLLLAHGALYAYRAPTAPRADCRLLLAGLTVSRAPEVKSRAHAFKVYHTGTAFYFATRAPHEQNAWLQLLARAANETPTTTVDVSKQFSETDCSDSETDTEHDRAREETNAKEKDKDRSKFNSLKKLTHRVHSQDNVSRSSTSLDRKYLRFFSRGKKEDKNKIKAGVPVPTEHYRSYRRVTTDTKPPSPALTRTSIETEDLPTPDVAHKKIPKPINYIHASNPNLLDFEKSDFVTKPNLQVPKTKVHKQENFMGFVTLEEFMLKKQEEERTQVYTNRVLMGIERDKKEASGKKAAKDLQKRLERIVPDVIYGELPVRHEHASGNASGNMSASMSPSLAARTGNKPISVKGKDGYEKIVYPDDKSSSEEAVTSSATGSSRRDKPWRDSLRRNDKVHQWETASGSKQPPPVAEKPQDSISGPGVSRLRLMFGGSSDAQRPLVQYPHLQCPPTFTPETYSLAALAPASPQGPATPQAPAPGSPALGAPAPQGPYK